MGKPGRPTDALKHRFQRILEEANAYEKFKQILIKTKKEDVFLKAFDVCHDRAFGKAPQYVEMDVNDVSQRPEPEALDDAIRNAENLVSGKSVEDGK